MYLDVEGGANLSKRAETALNMCAPGVCRETQVVSIPKKIILASSDWPSPIVLLTIRTRSFRVCIKEF